ERIARRQTKRRALHKKCAGGASDLPFRRDDDAGWDWSSVGCPFGASWGSQASNSSTRTVAAQGFVCASASGRRSLNRLKSGGLRRLGSVEGRVGHQPKTVKALGPHRTASSFQLGAN